MNTHYNRNTFVEALKSCGMRRGDTVFTHSNIGYFGIPEEGNTQKAVFDTIFGAFIDVIGEEGTLVVPTFTLSFCKGLIFNPDESPSFCGLFAETVRQLPGSYRSEDPLFSVAAFGKQARTLTAGVSEECFGSNSFWERFRSCNGVICNMNFDAGSTFIHYVEHSLSVPYRFDKLFTGKILKNGNLQKSAVIFFCQDLSNPDTVASFELFDELARKKQLVRSASIGRGSITVLNVADTYDLVKKEIQKNPWFLTVAGKQGKKPILIKNIDPHKIDIPLDKDSSMKSIIEKLWKIPRDIVSDGYDSALFSLQKVADMRIHRYPTGSHCWTWIIPEKWRCMEAYLETMDGKRIFDYKDNPLHCVSYSLPFEGTVSKEELFAHLYTHPFIPEAIPFIFKPYEREWGLCCSERTKKSLAEKEYTVVIKTEFSYGELKVGEVIIPGHTEESFVLCAHLCHTYMTNDDLAGVAVGMEVMRRLKEGPTPYFTCRLLIVPETIGSIAWLSRNESLIPKIKGGLFLEMVGRDAPHALQLSFFGNTEIDKSLLSTLQSNEPDSWAGRFCTVIQNDEKQFNAPGVRVPMLSLSRVERADSKRWPYPEYHSDYDNMGNISPNRLEESCQMVIKMLQDLERNYCAQRRCVRSQ